MDETANLKLPYILAAQSQKHVTHNEALRALDAIVQLAVLDKDLGTPPGSPADGDRYIVGGSPSGSWSGHATHVAAWQDGIWTFHAPVAGWLAWVDDESQSYLFAGGGWVPAPGGAGATLVPKGAWSSVATYATGDLVEHEGYAFLSNVDDNLDNEPDAATPGSTSEWTYFSVVTGSGAGEGGGGEGGVGSVNPVALVGVNATADATNRLSVSSPASLFNHEGAGHQLKINKDASSDTASVLFQTDFSGRAEFGLAGDDDFHVKVSPDGSTWHEALVIDRASGAVRAAGLREVLAANRTYYVRADGSDSNDGLTDAPGGAFLTLQKAIDVAASLDLSVYSVTVQVGAGTYTSPTVLKSYVGAGPITVRGDVGTPANVIVSTTSANCFTADGVLGKYRLEGLKLQTTTSGRCLASQNGSYVEFGALDFGTCAQDHILCENAKVVNVGTNYTISGNAGRHVLVNNLGYVRTTALTVTLTGTPAFSAHFANANAQAVFACFGNTYSGSATGTRYSVSTGGLINSNGGGANYLPGNGSGSAATQGQFV
jgi:hypothetical protein